MNGEKLSKHISEMFSPSNLIDSDELAYNTDIDVMLGLEDEEEEISEDSEDEENRNQLIIEE